MPTCTLCHAPYEPQKRNPLRRCVEHRLTIWRCGDGDETPLDVWWASDRVMVECDDKGVSLDRLQVMALHSALGEYLSATRDYETERTDSKEPVLSAGKATTVVSTGRAVDPWEEVR